MLSRDDDGDDECGCTFGKSCAYHAEREQESRRQWEALCEEKGWDPYGEVTDEKLEKVIAATFNDDLSQRQRDELWRQLFPRKKTP